MQRPQHLIRTQVPHDLRAEDGLDHPRVDRPGGMEVLQLVERADHTVPHVGNGIEEALGQDELRGMRSDFGQHGGQLAPHGHGRI